MPLTPQIDGFVLITGAASGIGKETAFTFAEHGISGIVLADINFEACVAAAEESKKFAINPGYKALAIAVDVSDESSVDNLIKTAFAEMGTINYFVHSAGVGPAALDSVDEVTSAEFDRVNGINTRGTFLAVRAMSKAMLSQPERSIEHRNGPRSIGRGSIVVVASGLGLLGMAGNLSYCTSKHAILGLVKTAGFDLAAKGIRINAVCPGWVDTPFVPMAHPWFKAAAEANAFRRPARPDEIADSILFLSSSSSTYMTGCVLKVDAGASEEFALYGLPQA